MSNDLYKQIQDILNQSGQTDISQYYFPDFPDHLAQAIGKKLGQKNPDRNKYDDFNAGEDIMKSLKKVKDLHDEKQGKDYFHKIDDFNKVLKDLCDSVTKYDKS